MIIKPASQVLAMPSHPGQAVIICVWLDAFCVTGNNKNDYYGKDGVNKLRKQPGHFATSCITTVFLSK